MGEQFLQLLSVVHDLNPSIGFVHLIVILVLKNSGWIVLKAFGCQVVNSYNSHS